MWEGANVSQRRGLGDWLTKGTPGAVPARCSDSRAGWSGEGSGCGREGRDGVGDGECGAKLTLTPCLVLPHREISAETDREPQQLQNYWSEVRYMVRCIYRQAGTPLADDQDQSLVPDKEGVKELVDRYTCPLCLVLPRRCPGSCALRVWVHGGTQQTPGRREPSCQVTSSGLLKPLLPP